MNGIFDYAIHDSVISHNDFTHFMVCPFGYNSPRQWCFCDFASAFSQSFDPGTGGAGIVPRDIPADLQQVSSCPVGPEKLHGSKVPRASSSSRVNAASSITRPEAESDNPSSMASRNIACSLSRSNSAGVRSTAAGFPFCVMTNGRFVVCNLRITREAWVLNSPTGRMSSEICKSFMSRTSNSGSLS